MSGTPTFHQTATSRKLIMSLLAGRGKSCMTDKRVNAANKLKTVWLFFKFLITTIFLKMTCLLNSVTTCSAQAMVQASIS